MKQVVLDSFALLAFLRKEPGGEKVQAYFAEALSGKVSLWMCSVNWAEVGYIVIRKRGVTGWRKVQTLMADLPFGLVETSPELTDQASQYKAAHNMSLADAYAAALANIKKAELVTGDPEFRPLEPTLKGIVWLNAEEQT